MNNKYYLKHLLINAIFFSGFTISGFCQISTNDSINTVKELIPECHTVSSVRTFIIPPFNSGLMIAPQELIIGKVAGLSISSNDGAPGSGFSIINRGISTFYTSSSPMIIVDGLIMNEVELNINPSDIESFTILKDAASQAIYGEKAINGVILISTKKSSKKLRVSYSGALGLSVLPQKQDIYPASKFRDLIIKRYGTDSDAANLLGNANTDWLDEIYQNAIVNDHHLAVSGSYKQIPLRLSVGKTDQNGIIKTSDYHRTTIDFSTNPEFFDHHLKIGLDLKTISNQSRKIDDYVVYNASNFDPTQTVKNNSPFGGYFAWTENDDLNALAPANPMALLELTNHTLEENRLMANIKVEYQLHFLPDLSFFINYGQDRIDFKDHTLIDTVASWRFGRGKNEKNDLKYANKQIDAGVNYTKLFKLFPGLISIKSGYSYLSNYKKTKYYWGTSEIPAVEHENYTSTDEINRSWWYSSLSYLHNKKYFINFTLTGDKNSFYNVKYQKAYYPTVCLGWYLDRESFFNKNHFFNELKISTSYGKSGCFQEPEKLYYVRHEEVSVYDFELEYSIFNNRVWGTFDFYRKTGDKLLNDIPIPSGDNFNNHLLINAGKVRNTGIETQINAIALSTDDYAWLIGGQVAYNKNKIISLGFDNSDWYLSTGTIMGGVGNAVQVQKPGHSVGSFYLFQQIYDQSGNPVEGLYSDFNNSGSVNEEDRHIAKSYIPKVMLGIWSELNYKNWEFLFGGRLHWGNYIYNNLASNSYYSRLYGEMGYLGNISTTNFEKPQYLSDYYLENASFFKMDYITLGYCFKHLFNKDINLHFALSGQNLFVISKCSLEDPESVSGIEGFNYPRPRTYSISLKLDL